MPNRFSKTSCVFSVTLDEWVKASPCRPPAQCGRGGSGARAKTCVDSRADRRGEGLDRPPTASARGSGRRLFSSQHLEDRRCRGRPRLHRGAGPRPPVATVERLVDLHLAHVPDEPPDHFVGSLASEFRVRAPFIELESPHRHVAHAVSDECLASVDGCAYDLYRNAPPWRAARCVRSGTPPRNSGSTGPSPRPVSP